MSTAMNACTAASPAINPSAEQSEQMKRAIVHKSQPNQFDRSIKLIDTLIFNPSRFHQYTSDNQSKYHILFAPSIRIICAIFVSITHRHPQNLVGFVLANKKHANMADPPLPQASASNTTTAAATPVPTAAAAPAVQVSLFLPLT
jgi:hypothetical protein